MTLEHRQETTTVNSSSTPLEAKGRQTHFTGKGNLHEVELESRQQCTHDAFLYRFRWVDKALVSGVECGQHIRVHNNGKRSSYTPISDSSNKGWFEFVIKVYPSLSGDSDGSFSRYLNTISIGDRVLMSGPTGQTFYQGDGYFYNIKLGTSRRFSRVGMIAGGVGITPLLAITRRILDNAPTDSTRISMLYTNKTEEDIIFRKELEAYANQHPSQFSLSLTLTQQTTFNSGGNSPHSIGRFDAEMIDKAMKAGDAHAKRDDILMLICGKKSMIKAARSLCEQLGYSCIYKC